MDKQTIINLYLKEREYQKSIFGEYQKNDALNVSSFLNFIETYLEKAKRGYSEPWTSLDNVPDWFVNCKEFQSQSMAPVKTYEYLIKTMALAGAALEAFCEIDPTAWREDGTKEKWNK